MKKINKLLFWLSIPIIGTLSSCTSTQVFTTGLKPNREPTEWVNGEAFLNDSLYGVMFDVGYAYYTNNTYVFDYKITNKSNLDYLVDPSNYYYIAYDSLYHELGEGKIYAINPTDSLQHINQDILKREKRTKNHFGISLLAATVDIATGIAAYNDRNPRNDWKRTHFFELAQIQEAVNESKTQDLRTLKGRFSNSLLLKTTLKPNYEIYGKIYFKAFPQAQYIKLCMPVDDQVLEMIFKQVKHPATPSEHKDTPDRSGELYN